MRAYLASRYTRREELLQYAKVLQLQHSWVVTSRWLLGHHERDSTNLADLQLWAEEDYEDVLSCDTLIAFTETDTTYSRGGRHVEFGMALGYGKALIVIGPRENVFHNLPQVEHYDSFYQFERHLIQEESLYRARWTQYERPR